MSARIKISVSTYERLVAAENELASIRGAGARERRKVLGQVLDVFGLREAYPDVEKTRKEIDWRSMTILPTSINVPCTDLGVEKFASDLEKAAAASVGNSALKTIRKAIKEATK